MELSTSYEVLYVISSPLTAKVVTYYLYIPINYLYLPSIHLEASSLDASCHTSGWYPLTYLPTHLVCRTIRSSELKEVIAYLPTLKCEAHVVEKSSMSS